MAIRVEIALGHVKTHEFVVETPAEARRVLAALANRYWRDGRRLGGAVERRADLPRTWPVPVGAVIP